MLQLSRNRIAAVAAVAAAAIGGTTIANAGTGTQSQRPAGGAGEKALTGETAAKVRAAALAEVSGTVLRVETDRGGVYEAHIRKADGTEVEVAVDKDFEVTGVEEFGAGGPGGPGRGHGGPGHHMDLAAIASKLGVSQSALEDAVEDARPARGARPDHGDRAAALAKGLSKSEADVREALTAAEAAHRAEHDAERTKMYAAIAKAIDKTPAQVKAAFEAARPERPTR